MMKFLFSVLLILVIGNRAKCCDIDLTQNYSFRYLSVNNGLSQNSITSILQDSKGFIWIGTYDGLNRFDGFSVQTRRHISNMKNSLSDNRILSLHEDAKGRILIGTEGGGINILDTANDQITRIENANFSGDIVQTLATDHLNRIWSGSNKGLTIFSEPDSKGNVRNMFFPIELKGSNVRSLLLDKNKNMWIGTDSGLFVYRSNNTEKWDSKNLLCVSGFQNELVTSIFQTKYAIWAGSANGLYQIESSHLRQPSATRLLTSKVNLTDITGIAGDPGGNLWVSTKGKGVIKLALDQNGTLLSEDQYVTEKPFCNIAENSINTVYVDRSNTLWVGSYQKGLNYTDLSPKKFNSFYPLMHNETGVFGYKGKYITSVLVTPDDIWTGTINEGLIQYNKCTKKLTYFKPEISAESICSIFQTKDKTIWVGASNGLFKIVGVGTSAKKMVRAVTKRFVARSVCEDAKGNLWIATWDGLLRYDKDTGRITALTTADCLSSNSVYVVYQDPHAPVIWAGTIGGGLNSIRYDQPEGYKISVYKHQINNAASLSSNHIWCLHRDQKNTLWVGTDAGLNKLTLDASATVRKNEIVSAPSIKDRKIMAILEDNSGNLWLSGSQGLFQYAVASNTALHFTYQDGLQSNTLTEAAFKADDGVMYFGGINGLNYFRPQEKRSDSCPLITAFTDFRITNKSVDIGDKVDGNVILEKDINHTQSITLSHKQRDFSIGFASLHYATPENNKFRYRLEGYDKTWIVTDYTQRTASYSNLDPGNYHFVIASSDGDGFEKSPVRKIEIIILPAPWATWWAKTIYILAALTALYLILNHFKTRQKLKNELFREKLEKEKEKELNEIKLDFFTNITHEIRTPLNLILNPLKDLLDVASNYDQFTSMRLKIIHRNSFKLYSLINQILDLRKISSDSGRLVVTQENLVQTLLDVKASFNWLAEQKNIRFDYRSPRYANVWFDRDKIEKVVFNLISNAFKYTPEGGTIALSLTMTGSYAEQTAHISIQDSGIGIDPDEQERIFEMYYQSAAHYNPGTGIGLSLCKKLIEMHGGAITLASATGEGSEFVVTFPVSKSSFHPENIQEHEPEVENQQTTDFAGYTNKTNELDLTKKSILVIEDNEDQRAYLKDCLFPHFHVIDAENGSVGVEMARKYQPDIIITDLMMPTLNGMDVCRHIKSNARTSHIPVIVHSVKNSGQTIKDALLAGADDFIGKPYDYAMLTLKVNNILKSTSQLVMSIHKKDIINPAELTIPSLEKELLKKIVNAVEKNIADPDFGVERLCDEIGMSRMNLHRKLNAIIGKTASEFIREIRIKRAAQLMASGSKRVSEVMDEVGISSNTHFNKYFKEMHGQSPKEFMKNPGELNAT